MKWKPKERPFPLTKYKVGDRRKRVIFTWLPRKCKDGYFRWLEKIFVHEEYVKYTTYHGGCDDPIMREEPFKITHYGWRVRFYESK
jgi:hypothetical protein